MIPLADIEAAAARLQGHLQRTPCLASRTLPESTGAQVFFKFENLQFAAALKARGACNKLAQLSAAEQQRGVMAMSAANHARQQLVVVHPCDAADIGAGQGTVALKMLQAVPELDTLVVAVGGGLTAGMATAARAIKPGIEIIGMQTARFPAMVNAIKGLQHALVQGAGLDAQLIH